MEQHADSLGQIIVPAEPVAVAVRVAHSHHKCEKGQNTADCGHRYGTDPHVDAASFEVVKCVVCLDLANLPCRWCGE